MAMKKLYSVVTLLLVVSLMATGCSGRKGEVGAVLGHGFPLGLGQKAVVFSAGLEIKFVEILEDSRCPGGVECIWPGRISVMVEFKDNDGSYNMVLVQPGLSDEYEEEAFKSYRIQYKVTPYPQNNAQIKQEDYRLLLVINQR